ncbi:MAG: HEAT repeat domain-containing protein [Chloroflexi bacterium]|nr:HEAT repeat domain-containing protein [Chloroflexota bacterium]
MGQHVYISYRSENGEFVAELTRQLEGAGFQVWSENERLRVDETWREPMDQAMRDAFALVTVMTPAANASEHMKYEWTFSLGVGVKVIVLIIEPTDLPPRLMALPRLEFGDPAARPWGRLIRLVQEAFDSQRRPILPARPGLERQAAPPLGSPRPNPFERRRREFDDENSEGGQTGSAKSVPDLIKILQDEDANGEERAVAARRLGEAGDKSAIPALTQSLRDDDWNVREAAARALGKLKAAGAVVGLLEALRWGRPGPFGGGGSAVFVTAIREIGALAVPVLVDALGDEDVRMRLHVVDLLRELGESESVIALAGALRDPEWRVRWKAADALGRLGSPAAVPDLVSMLTDNAKDVQIAAAWALGKIKHESAVPGLVKLLRDREWRVRWAAAEALWEIGEVAVPGLLETLRDPDEYVRRAAVRALAEIGEPAIPELIRTLSDTNWDVRWSAAAALQEIGNLAVPALVTTLTDQSWQTAWAAAETLKRIGTPEAMQAVEVWRKGRESGEHDRVEQNIP